MFDIFLNTPVYMLVLLIYMPRICWCFLASTFRSFLRAIYMKATRAEGPLGSTIVLLDIGLLDRVLLKKIKKIKTKGIFYKKI